MEGYLGGRRSGVVLRGAPEADAARAGIGWKSGGHAAWKIFRTKTEGCEAVDKTRQDVQLIEKAPLCESAFDWRLGRPADWPTLRQQHVVAGMFSNPNFRALFSFLL